MLLHRLTEGEPTLHWLSDHTKSTLNEQTAVWPKYGSMVRKGKPAVRQGSKATQPVGGRPAGLPEQEEMALQAAWRVTR